MKDEYKTNAVRHQFHGSLEASPDLSALTPTGASYRLFLQQGEMDCACGVYCLAMALILVGAMSRRQLNRHLTSTRVRAALDEILFSGSHAADLLQLARRLCAERSFTLLEGSHRAVLAGVTAAADVGVPALLAVEDAQQSYSHWVLVVGIEHRSEINQPSALLAIDPGAGRHAPLLQFYNWKLLLAAPRRGARYLRCVDTSGRRRSVTCTEALIVH